MSRSRDRAARREHIEESDDAAIDALFPEGIAELSARHFSPVSVARRAAELLAPTSDHRVLDLGAGPGKFCIVGAAWTGASFTGIEHRKHFVKAAIEAAARSGVANAHFIHANMLELSWRPYDSYYLFNPFAEQLLGGIDGTVTVSPARFAFYVREVRERLRLARMGTRVVTYHGFGGNMPPSFRLVLREQAGSDELELWVKDHRAEIA
jgi:SAM-dependent methyltransferase